MLQNIFQKYEIDHNNEKHSVDSEMQSSEKSILQPMGIWSSQRLSASLSVNKLLIITSKEIDKFLFRLFLIEKIIFMVF